MVSNRDRGKDAERAVAKLLGGMRIGTLSGEDVHFDGPFSAEVKSRGAFVACDWMVVIRASCTNLQAVVVTTPRALAICR